MCRKDGDMKQPCYVQTCAWCHQLRVFTSPRRRIVELCVMSPNEVIWCGSDRDAMVETGCFGAKSQAQLSVFEVDQR